MTKTMTASLRTRWLGERLRAARIKAGYKLSDVGEYLQLDHTTLGRFERGTHRIRHSYVKDLIDFYGISDSATRDALLKLNEDSWRRDWWHGDSSDLEVNFIDYTWLEARSAKIYTYEPMLVPGLLQTREYTDALMAHGRGDEIDPRQRSRLVDLRMARQQVLMAENPTPLSSVIGQAALDRPVAPNHVLVKQLQRLADLALYQHIDIRILPSSIGWHVGLQGSFRWFEMPDPYTDVAYFENIAVRMFVEEDSKVEQYRDAYDSLHRLSLNASESIDLIKTTMKGLK